MSYKVLYQAGEDEIEEKKSRFIAHTLPVNSEDEAVAFLNKIKKEYWDARHNCYAYTIGRNNECTRCSDDGEPSGTAGLMGIRQIVQGSKAEAAVTKFPSAKRLGMRNILSSLIRG